MFNGCTKLKNLNILNWDASKITTIGSMFHNTTSLETLIGYKSIDEVLEGLLSCMNNLKIGIDLSYTQLDRASLRALINGLADLTGQTAQTLTLGATLMAKLTEEDIAIAVNKNWTLS
jgi:surface protein